MMDSAMRDLERMRERDEGDGSQRRFALLGLAGITTVALILALSLQVSGDPIDSRLDADPLARLAPTEGLVPTEIPAEDPNAGTSVQTDEIDRVGLTFPETLQHETRPEVAAALAAASAELRHPDPLTPTERATSTARLDLAPVRADDIETRIPAALPAAIAAGTGGSLARVGVHDRMVQDALPSTPQLGGNAVGEGHDGEYTVQVISYDSPEGAHAFAAGLRVRGHRAFVMRAEVENRGTVYRVRIGPFETMAEAQTYRRQFEESESMNVIVVRRR
jgi:cell division septation protein DedD